MGPGGEQTLRVASVCCKRLFRIVSANDCVMVGVGVADGTGAEQS